MGQIIKQSTNILAQNVEKRYDDQRHEMMVNINEVFEREVSKMRQQNLNSIFDTWNYLSEIKVSLKDILTSLTIQTRQPSENLKTKVGNCQELVLQLQQKMEKKSSPPNQKLKSIQYLLPTEDSSELEVECSQSDSVDEFHTILYSETDVSDSMNNGQSGDFETTSFDEQDEKILISPRKLPQIAKIDSREELSINHQFLDDTFDEQCEIILKARQKSPKKIEKMNSLQNYQSIRTDNSKEELLEHSINQSDCLENTFDHKEDETNLKSLQKSLPKIEKINRNQNYQSVRGVDSKTELSDESSSKDEFHTPMSEFETSSLNVGQTSQSLSFSNKIEFEPILEEMPEKSQNKNVVILQNYQSTNTANISCEVTSKFDTDLKKNIKINECHRRKALVSLRKFSKSDVEKMIGYKFSRQAQKKIAKKRFQHTALPKKSNFIKTTNKKNECFPDKTDFDEDEFQGGFRRRKAIEKTRNLLRSKSTLLRTINFPGNKRNLLDEEEMLRILIETRQDLSQIDHALGRSNNNNIPAQEPCFLPSTTKREPVKTGYKTPDYSCNQTFLSTISTVY